MTWVLAVWERLPAWLRAALVAIGGMLATAIVFFFTGRRRGRDDARADEIRGESRRDRRRIDEARTDAESQAAVDDTIRRR